MAFNTEPPGGYFVIPQEEGINDDSNPDHIFCGSNDVQDAICPNCRRPLLRFLSLDTKDHRLYLEADFPKLFLMFCWTCDLSQGPFYYVQHDEGSIDILEYRKGECYNDFPYENYPIYFPQLRAVLEAIPNEDQEIIRALNRDTIDEWGVLQSRPELCGPRHQIGGEPYLLQRNLEDNLRCLLCSNSMPFLATIGNDGPKGTQFTESEFVQVLFHYCRKCTVVGAYQQTD